MAFFRKRAAIRELSPIASFWRWWSAEGEELLTAAISDGDFGRLPDRVSQRVELIHPELQWETAAGQSARHVFCVTGAGVADLRPIAERWLRAAPAPSATWEFAAARRRDPKVLETKLGFAGTILDLALTRAEIQVDEDRMLIDVCIFHPSFAEIPDEAARQATFLILDWLLGEDDVERWIAGIDTVVDDPDDSLPIDAVLEAVEAMAQRHVDPVWILLEATTSRGERALITTMRPLRWIDHPLLDLHSEIHVPFSPRRDDGLPTPEALFALREYEDGLAAVLGTRGMLLAHETFDGRRVFHVYTDSEDQNARDAVDLFRPDTVAQCTHSLDANWKRMRQFAER